MKKKMPMPIHKRMKMCPLLKPSTVSFLHVSFSQYHGLLSISLTLSSFIQMHTKLYTAGFSSFVSSQFLFCPPTNDDISMSLYFYFYFFFLIHSIGCSFFDMLSCCTELEVCVYFICTSFQLSSPILFYFQNLLLHFHLLAENSKRFIRNRISCYLSTCTWINRVLDQSRLFFFSFFFVFNFFISSFPICLVSFVLFIHSIQFFISLFQF